MLLYLLQFDFSHPERRRAGRVLGDGAARHECRPCRRVYARPTAATARGAAQGDLRTPLPLIRNRFQNDRPENHCILRFLDFHEICIAASTSLPIAFQRLQAGSLRAFSMIANGSPSGSEIAYGTEEL